MEAQPTNPRPESKMIQEDLRNAVSRMGSFDNMAVQCGQRVNSHSLLACVSRDGRLDEEIRPAGLPENRVGTFSKPGRQVQTN